jgi:hypothetical protein
MTDIDVIDALWAKIEPIAFITRDQFARGLEDWNIEVMRAADGELALVAMTQGSEFHLDSFGKGIPITPKMINERFEPLMKRYGCVTTRTPIEGEDRQHRFNRAFGFKEVGRDEFFVHYRKDAPCRSSL